MKRMVYQHVRAAMFHIMKVNGDQAQLSTQKNKQKKYLEQIHHKA